MHIQLRYWYTYVIQIITAIVRFAQSPLKLTHGCTFL